MPTRTVARAFRKDGENYLSGESIEIEADHEDDFEQRGLITPKGGKAAKKPRAKTTGKPKASDNKPAASEVESPIDAEEVA